MQNNKRSYIRRPIWLRFIQPYGQSEAFLYVIKQYALIDIGGADE
jgi:hypothetical protein